MTTLRLENFSTSRKHSMDYVTVDGIILMTGYLNKRAWYHLVLQNKKSKQK